MYTIPTESELANLRKKRKKIKVPEPFDGMWCSEPGVGGVRFEKDGEDLNVTWVHFTDDKLSEPKKVSFIGMNTNPDLENDRLHVGIVIANVLKTQGNAILQSIPGPNEAMKESKPYFNESERWYQWALEAPKHNL